jgi:hypothetical protein
VGVLQRPPALKWEDERIELLANDAPNIALNVRNSTAPKWELWSWAAIGIMLQMAALVAPALSTYHWKWSKGGAPITAYGYPCFLVGSLLVIVGLIFCGHVIEGSTTEHEFAAAAQSDYPTPLISQIVRLQKACTVSEQHFPSYAIFNTAGDWRIRTSRLNANDYR